VPADGLFPRCERGVCARDLCLAPFQSLPVPLDLRDGVGEPVLERR
jgi:hypothetical protein